ncbi:MAG: hypothetical protein ACK5CA_15020 [Cyanobacteriota bacterium]|jgi:hypothetical protein
MWYYYGEKLDIFKEAFYSEPAPLPVPPPINLATATRQEIKSGLDYLNNRPVNSLGLSAEKLANALDKIDGAPRQNWSESLKEVPALKCGITTAKLPLFKEIFYTTPAPIPPDITDPALLNTLSVAELKKLAQERGKTGAGRMTKKDWINLLSQP